MQPKSFTKRILYQNQFVVCKIIQFTEDGRHFFTVGMDLRNNHYAQRFISSGDRWVAKYDELFFNESKTKMLPNVISEELLKHLQEHYSISQL